MSNYLVKHEPLLSVLAGLDPSDIKRKVGEQRFALGQSLAQTFMQGEMVNVLETSEFKVVAAVKDSQFYVVNLNVSHSNIEGNCTCLVSENFDFCEHCVALVLYLNQTCSQLLALSAGNEAHKIQSHIAKLSGNEVEQALLEMILANPYEHQRWLASAEIKQGNAPLSLLKKMIVKALPLKEISQQAKLKDYFDTALTRLQDVFDLIDMLSAQHNTSKNKEKAFKITEYALLRYDAVMGRIDDSLKCRMPVITLLKAHFVAMFQQLPWLTSDKARYLISLDESDIVHVHFDDPASIFIPKNDHKLNQEYHRLLIKQVRDKGLTTNKATQSYSPQTLNKIMSIIRYYLAEDELEKAKAWLSLSSTSFTYCIRNIELCLQFKAYDLAKALLNLAQKEAKTAMQQRHLERIQHKFKDNG